MLCFGEERFAADAIRTALDNTGVQFLDNGKVATGPGVALKGERS